ncbi:sugar porter family MFS transporter [Nocardia sp. NPDC050712]|uniref:sugar porter family MFS transporter n=1 Tax=Nocardia sp. NPDC050712 TaxID=3155518 RepID=UPI0033D67EB5
MTASRPHPDATANPGAIGANVVFVAAAAAMGGFLFGYDSSVINGAVTGIQHHFGISSATMGFIVAAALPGAAVGALAAGWLADRFGRTRVMQLSALLFAVSGVGSMFAFGDVDLTVWRFLGGIAIGQASVVAPAYIAEVAPPSYRGRLASFQQLAIVLGIAFSALVNYLIATAAGGSNEAEIGGLEAWRWMLGAEVVPALVYGAVAFLIPESPRYLIANGREDEARKVLAEVENDDPAHLDQRVDEIRKAMAGEVRSGPRDLLSHGRGVLLPIVWIGIGISALQQFVGINVIFYYSSLLWQQVGIDTSNSLLVSMISSVINIVGTVIAMSLVDKVGRKPLLLVGSTGMAVTLGLCAWMFTYVGGTQDDPSMPKVPGTVALVSANLYVLFYALSWGVVVWVLLGEMFPNRIRAIALSVAACAQWLANWLVTVSFPSLSEWSLAGAYGLYALAALVSIPFVRRLVRETKGRTLESMG